LDRKQIDPLAARLDFPMDWSQETTLPAQAALLLDRYSLRATCFFLDKVREFARHEHKKLMVVLFDPYRAMMEMRQAGTRYDQEIVAYLKSEKINYFDMNEIQLADFQQSKLSYQDYMKQYFIGHYNPAGNHFFAYCIKDRVVEWLDPKPVTYRGVDPQTIDFRGYLPEFH
jgi:hypothetical protein